jgi:hypothetical protein
MERQVVLGGDAGHQRLGPVAAGHPQQVGAVGHRLPGQRGHVDGSRPCSGATVGGAAGGGDGRCGRGGRG